MHTNYRYIVLNESSIYSEQSFALDLLIGLSSTPKFIPAKYHYNKKGSQLFQKITQLNEYYPTQCEFENLKYFKHDLDKIITDKSIRVIEFGVGEGFKTKVLLQHFLELNYAIEYIPIDCCHDVISTMIQSLPKEYNNHPNLKVLGITAEYSNAMEWLSKENQVRNLVLFLGSNIGNFTPIETTHFLFQMWNALKDGDYVLIGFDLKKEISVLELAYNDKHKVTAEFNLNLLDRINHELGANFNRKKFNYHSFYNPKEERIESWLMSSEEQIIKIPKLQKEFYFDSWEGIHVENSYKYSLKQIEHLAKSTGFACRELFIDPKGYFVEAIWEVKKNITQHSGANFDEYKRSIIGSISQR